LFVSLFVSEMVWVQPMTQGVPANFGTEVDIGEGAIGC
jgi:hypothetical protein